MLWEGRGLRRPIGRKKCHANSSEFPKIIQWDEKPDLLTPTQILFCFHLPILFLKINTGRKVDPVLSWFSRTSNAHGTNIWLLKNSSPHSLCLCLFSGSCPSEGRTWPQEPDVGWATSLCANTKSFMYWQMATPQSTVGVPTCIIGRELVYNILGFHFCSCSVYLMFSWFIFGHMSNKWMEKSDSILSQQSVCLVRAWIS